MPRAKSTKSGGKGTPKHSAQGRSARKNAYDSDDDSVNGDTASILSMNSERGSYEDVGENGNGEFDDDTASVIGPQSREVVLEKINEAVDGMTEKSANVRTTSINNLIGIFSQQFVPELVLGRKETIRDNTEKLFKRGLTADKELAATLASVTSLQVGAIDIEAATEDFNMLKPALVSLLLDYTAPVAVRIKCCQGLCLGAFLAETSLDDIYSILAVLEPLFGVSGKGAKSAAPDSDNDASLNAMASPSKMNVKIPKSSCANLAATAIAGWALLLTVIPPEILTSKAGRWIRILRNLLDHAELEVRVGAGEAVALLVEICELDPETEEEDESSDEEINGVNGAVLNGHGNKINMKSLISKLRELSVQSHKYQAKRDRRQQKHSFRDFLHAVENGEGPGQSIKFGFGEVFEVDTWAKKRRYDAICQVLGSGMNRHLIENILVRQILELGSPKLNTEENGFGSKTAKSERQYLNQVNFKARCVSRGKSRDQRMATLSEF